MRSCASAPSYVPLGVNGTGLDSWDTAKGTGVADGVILSSDFGADDSGGGADETRGGLIVVVLLVGVPEPEFGAFSESPSFPVPGTGAASTIISTDGVTEGVADTDGVEGGGGGLFVAIDTDAVAEVAEGIEALEDGGINGAGGGTCSIGGEVDGEGTMDGGAEAGGDGSEDGGADVDGMGVGDSDGTAEVDDEDEACIESDGEDDGIVEADAGGVIVGVAVGVDMGVAEMETVVEGEVDTDMDALADTDGEAVSDGIADIDVEAVRDGEDVGVSEDVGVAVVVSVDVGVGVAVAVFVGVGVIDSDIVGVGVVVAVFVVDTDGDGVGETVSFPLSRIALAAVQSCPATLRAKRSSSISSRLSSRMKRPPSSGETNFFKKTLLPLSAPTDKTARATRGVRLAEKSTLLEVN